ncbi:Potassium voltage-gated channel subfamily C member 1 [Mactra antiquata]
MFTIKVGNKTYNITRSSAKSIEGSLLSKIATHEISETVFDRDSQMFRFILNAHRTGTVHVPRDVCPHAFREEMMFWRVPLKSIAPCCWKTVHEVDEQIETLKLLIGEEKKLRKNNKKRSKVQSSIDNHFDGRVGRLITQTNNAEPSQVEFNSWKYRIWIFLEEPGSSIAAKVWCIFYILLVILSVIIFVLWTQSISTLPVSIPKEKPANETHVDHHGAPMKNVSDTKGMQAKPLDTVTPNETHVDKNAMKNVSSTKGMKGKPTSLIAGKPSIILFSIDIFCMIFFTIESILNFYVCPYKKKYLFDVYNATKVVLCITMVITALFESKAFRDSDEDEKKRLDKVYFACRSLNVLRLILLFKLRKVYNGLHILLLTMERCMRQLLLLVFSFGIAVIMFGCLIFSAEIESDMFPSTQISMWWALITMTTIGYGDYFPTTTYGYIIGSLCAISGVIVIALPVASIAGTFDELYARNSDLQKHKKQVEDEMNNQIKELKEVKELALKEANID